MGLTVEELRKQFYERLMQANAADAFEELRVRYLGKKGEITGLLKNMGAIAPDKRKEYGAMVNALKEEVESLRVKLMTAQNELLKEKDRIIELQDEAKKTLEDRARYTALLEESKAKDDQIRTIQTEAEDLRKKSEEDQKTIEDLQKERDEARTEAQSFTRSIFGFYRKK